MRNTAAMSYTAEQDLGTKNNRKQTTTPKNQKQPPHPNKAEDVTTVRNTHGSST